MRITILAVTCIVLISAGSLNAWEVKFVPQTQPLEIKKPPVESGDKIIVKEPLKIPIDVMTKPLPPKLQPGQAPAVVETGEEDAAETPPRQAGVGAIEGDFEEVEENVPIGPSALPRPPQIYPAARGAQTAGAELIGGAMPAGPPPAGGCGKPILVGIITETASENIEAQGEGTVEGQYAPYPYEYPPPEYYYDDAGAGAGTRTARPPGIYFRDEEEPAPPGEGEYEEQ